MVIAYRTVNKWLLLTGQLINGYCLPELVMVIIMVIAYRTVNIMVAYRTVNIWLLLTGQVINGHCLPDS